MAFLSDYKYEFFQVSVMNKFLVIFTEIKSFIVDCKTLDTLGRESICVTLVSKIQVCNVVRLKCITSRIDVDFWGRFIGVIGFVGYRL